MFRSEVATWSALVLLGCHAARLAVPAQAVPAKSQASIARISAPTPALEVFPKGASPISGPAEFEQPVVAIATALWASCALLEDHSVWCWGDDHSRSTDGYQNWIRQIPLSGASKLVGANERMFAITTSGELFHWGAEIGPRSGIGGGATPRRLPLKGVLDVAASWDDLCALERSGRITCWYGQSGPTVVATLPSAKSLTRSREQTCALLSSGTVTCLGKQQAASVRPDVAYVVELAAAGDTQCALRREGTIGCWPEGAQARSFTQSAGHDVRHLTGTPHALCAIKAAGPPHCMVFESGGDRDKPVLAPEQVFSDAPELTDVRFGPDHACTVAKGVVWCWGDNTFGQLGQPGAPQVGELLARVSLGDTSALHHVTRVAAGRYHRCVIVLDGTLRCWGAGDWGKLGTLDGAAHAGPTMVPGLSNVTDVVVNDTATCALLGDESLHCFGRQPWREDLPSCKMGEEESEEEAPCSSTPSLVAVGIAQIGLGEGHLCTLGSDARVRCWGNNDRGQLGTGDTKRRVTPTPVVSLAGHELGRVSKLRVFANHACAVMVGSGALECWGSNVPSTQGRPYNSIPAITRATPISRIAGAMDVSDRCILLRSGELRCWGNVFPDNHDFSYEPLRIGRCRVSELSTGLGPCFAENAGTTCLGLGDGGFHAPIALRNLAGSASSLCGVDARGSLACWNTDSSNVRPLIGTVAAADLPWPAPEHGCAHDSVPSALPRFPSVTPASVTAHDLQRGARGADNGVRLSNVQVSQLLNLLNDPQNYTSTSTCHEPRHQYAFRDAHGVSQATLGVSNDCLTIDSEPEIPAQRRGGGGNVVGAKLTRGLAELCRSLRLDGCPDGESPKQ